MSAIRWVLSKIILFLDAAFSPRAEIQRSAEEQYRVDQATSSMAIYQFVGCPFCVKVRRALKRMGLKIELRNADPGTQFADELVQGGGELQVPCLRITESDGSVRWMYESDDIIAYLAKRFAQAS